MGTWTLPNTKRKAQKLKELMEQPLLVSEDPQSKLYDLYGDDSLFDEIWNYEDDSNNDLRELVKKYISKYLYDYAENPESYRCKLSKNARAILEAILSE